MKIRVVGYWSYNEGEVVEQTVRLVTQDQIVTAEGAAYLRETGMPFTMHSGAYRIPREELQRLETEWARSTEAPGP